jgi:prepilin-type N-terminal cleavage/methylation domain-containing protein/prepilin-type processing-associated H-X9-DG protein
VKACAHKDGLTLLELLVVIAILAILAALLFPAFSQAKRKTQQAACISNLHQVSVSLHMYAQDSDDALPPVGADFPPNAFTAYVKLMKAYVGVNAAPGRATVFACPADTFYYDIPTMSRAYRISKPLHDLPQTDYSSYAFNGGNFPNPASGVPRWPGIAGRRLSSVKDPGKTLLVLEYPALIPYSWHQPASVPGHYNNAKCMVSFVDGHVTFQKMYWDAANARGQHLEAWQYNPPLEYSYKWSGD